VRTILLAVVVAGLTGFASAQTVKAPKLNFLADSVQQDGDKLQLHGHVRIAACSIVTGDEAVLDVGNNEVQLTGGVHMKLVNGVDSLSVIK